MKDYYIVSLTNRGAKTEFKAMKQQAKEDVLEYFEKKLSLFLQAYTPAECNLEQFKDSVIAGVLYTELMRGARSWLKVVQEEWEIKNALDVELKLTFRSQEPELQRCRAQGSVQQIQGHGMLFLQKTGSPEEIMQVIGILECQEFREERRTQRCEKIHLLQL